MGARGPTAKQPGVTISTIGASVAPFDPPDDLVPEVRAQWDAYWGDPVSTSPTRADRGLILRWIESLNRYVVYQALADSDPLTFGSKRQLVKNPMHGLAADALAVVERCEKQMGIGGKNRADLGIAIVAGQKSLADLNASYQQEPNGVEEPAAQVDPRVVQIRAKATARKKA